MNSRRYAWPFCAAVLLSLSGHLSAVPADSQPVVYTQPDGTTVTVQLHGDEFYHWMTAADGTVVAMNEDGYVVPSSLSGPRMAAASARRMRRMGSMRPERSSQLAFGSNHFLVMLIEFSDLHFTVSNPNQAFTNLLNQQGYSANGASGSAYDYYYENSSGRFMPVYDVAGPVRLSKSYAYYGENGSSGDDLHAHEALFDACKAYDSEIDFSQYDHDGDGVIDNIFFFYAGYNEAEGGGVFNKDAIWPHQWDLRSAGSNYSQLFDGVRIGSYACTSEYSGYTFLNRSMCGIGTFCHEFGHVLGLPDFYDTDYETNGEAAALYDFSIMCNGSYNDKGRTPPYFNAMERYMLGWMDLPPEMTSGTVSLPPVNENAAFRSLTSTEGEYFLYESRSKKGWDKALPEEGLLVYHVDQSERPVQIYVSGKRTTLTAKTLWEKWEETNCINENASHPCFYVVPAAASYASRYGSAYCPFPGGRNVTSFQPTDWDGRRTGDSFSSISFSSATGYVQMTATIVSSGSSDRVLLSEMGYASIVNPQNGQYKAGDTFLLEIETAASDVLSRSPQWFVDGRAVSASSVTLTAGAHVIRAELSYEDGSSETLELEITAEQ